MNAIKGYYLIEPEELFWRLSNLMKIPNADYLERTGSENLGARLWRLPRKSANTLHIYPVDPKQLPRELAGVGMTAKELTVAGQPRRPCSLFHRMF